MEPAKSQARSLYRSILRELPTHTIKSPSSPLRHSIRQNFQSLGPAASASNTDTSSPEYLLARRQETQQAIQYLKAQRIYTSLLERYNPGADMGEEERVRLTARRVGMDMPEEWYGTQRDMRAGENAGVKYGGMEWSRGKKE